MDNIFKHNSRTYHDMYNAFVQAYPNKPTWIFNEMAGMFDFMSELTNRIATDILYPKTRESAYAFAARCDYDPTESSAATVDMTITLTGAMVKTLTAGYQVGGISSSTGQMVIFELDSDSSSGGTDTITGSFTQKKSYTNKLLFTIDNQDDWMDYPVDGFLNVIKDSVSLTINALTWDRVDNFDNSISTDRHFKIIFQSSGKWRIQFGDGTNGLKPALNNQVYGDFSITRGSIGRLDAGDININVGGDSDIQSLTNASATSGGNDEESIPSIIRNARANARLRTMVWSKEDLETASRAASSSVVKALGIPSTGTAVIQIVPAGGGAPAGGLKTDVDTYVTALTQFGSMPITVNDPTYVTQAVTASTTIRTGYTGATVRDLVAFAMVMGTTAVDSEVIEYYDSYGIDSCRTSVINVNWAYAFTSSENEALAYIIDQWKTILGDRSYREWGQTLEVGDLWILGNSLYEYGVDVFNLTVPAANVSVTSVQIIDSGVITIT